MVKDFRKESVERTFDCVICLYDVIGSAAAPSSELNLLRNIKRHLRPGGYAVLSVMNLSLTQKKAIHRFTLEKEANRLLELKPSTTMEASGDVFNPEFYMLDTKTGVVYRKEQFKEGRDIPAELIVRDRRYTKKSITALVKSVELQVVSCRCVNAGGWQNDFDEDDDRAKEILLVCRRRPLK
jgi:SAM-dependent methyltransferase